MKSRLQALTTRYPPIIWLLALLAAFPALATDMYLPALPLLGRQWGVSAAVTQQTLVAFLGTYCGCLLVYGPLSDRYGRRPPLIVGVGLFLSACLVCGFSQGIGMMIWGRALQGAGAAAASGVVFAVSKDRFTGRQRQQVLLQIGAIVATAPMVAPLLGGWIMTLFSWRWIFLLQGLLGGLALVGVVRMEESLLQRLRPGLTEVAASYLRLLSNGRYALLLLALSCTCVPIFAFIAGSPDLYITRLGYTEHQFGLFFGGNSLAFALAPLCFSRIARRIPTIRLMPLALAGIGASALLLCTEALPAPWRLALPMFTMTFSFAFCRPAGNNLLLEQVDRDAGAASSLMVFSYFMTGALAIWFFARAEADKMLVLGVMGVASVACALGLWLLVCRRLHPISG